MKAFLLATLRMSVPYLLAASAGVVSERSGVINFALEGFMLVAAFVTALVALATDNLWLGALAGVLGGALYALGYYGLAARFRANQVLLGIAFNMAAIGITRFALKLSYDSASNSPRVAAEATLWPLVVLALAAVAWLVSRSRFAVRLTAAGDHPPALLAQGLSPTRVRATALMLGGALCGLAGATLVTSQHQFTDSMTAGRGYIAVAAVVFGGWRLVPVLLVCVLFAAAEVLDFELQAANVFAPQIAQMLPYVVCLLALGLRRTTHRAPLALGE
ncbi:MAG: ABC transporter permease [Deltaproteobacteria bacterium]|nr:ABC transporter permease [Deltaproteobacteria bacterium]